MKLLLTAIFLLASTGSYASDTIELNQDDATTVFGVLTEANLVESYPTAEHVEITDLKCEHVNEEISEKFFVSSVLCTGTSFEETVQIKDAQELNAVLSNVINPEDANGTDGFAGSDSGQTPPEAPTASEVAVKKLTCNYDRLSGNLTCTVTLK